MPKFTAPCEELHGVARMLDTEQVAALLGINKRSVMSAVERGELVYRKIGGKLIFPASQFSDWSGGDAKSNR